MVEFCSKCKTSLPYADVIISNGKVSMHKDYMCPSCRKPAHKDHNKDRSVVELDSFIVKDGKVKSE